MGLKDWEPGGYLFWRHGGMVGQRGSGVVGYGVVRSAQALRLTTKHL